MASRGRKRSGKAAATTASKSRRVDRTISLRDSVLKVLRTSEHVDARVRDIVVPALPALGVAKDQRNPTQTSLVKMIGDTLAQVDTGMQRAVQAAEEEWQAASTYVTDCETNMRDRKEHAESLADGRIEEKKAVTESNGELVRAAKEALLKASRASKTTEDKLSDLSSQKNDLSTAFEKVYVPLRDNTTSEPHEARRALQKLGKRFQFDEGLVPALVTALQVKEENRTSWHTELQKSMEQVFADKIKELEDAHERTAEGRGELSAAVQRAAAECNDKIHIFQVSREEEKSAKEALATARELLSVSKQTLTESERLASERKTQLDERKRAHGEFTAGALAAFNELKDLTVDRPGQ